MTLEVTNIEMRDCRLLELNISAPTLEGDEPNEAEIQLKNDYDVIGNDGGNVTVRYRLSLKPLRGSYYTASATAIAAFTFPEGAADNEVDGYLRTFALMRIYDWLRAVLESSSAACVFGPIRIPSDPPNLSLPAETRE